MHATYKCYYQRQSCAYRQIGGATGSDFSKRWVPPLVTGIECNDLGFTWYLRGVRASSGAISVATMNKAS